METLRSRTVAIIGRPNVGKSALFNRLAGRKISIVHDQPGITRDRLSAECRLGKGEFTVFDTGGIGSDVDANFSEQVRAEVDIALATSEVILFVVDGQEGLTPVDSELAKQLRRAGKPLILVVNKIDHEKHRHLESEFAKLGFERVVSVSAEHARGIGELVAQIEPLLPTPLTAEEKPEEPPAIAIVGRPNVGKSSLLNAILQDTRTLVSEIAGTTRDAVDVPCERNSRHFLFIDTAGIRPRGKHDSPAEVFSVMRSERSIRRADLCVLVIDATSGLTAQDKKIAGLIQAAHKPCVVAFNKWDLVKAELTQERNIRARLEEIRAELFFLDYAPIVLLSAKTGENIGRIFRCVEEVRKDAAKRIGTGPLNRLLHEALAANPPPMRRGRRFKIVYATQVEASSGTAIPPPTFVLFVNNPALMPQTYRKYLETRIRAKQRLMGLPILFEFRGRETRGRSS
jgi:GTP-binding protein